MTSGLTGRELHLGEAQSLKICVSPFGELLKVAGGADKAAWVADVSYVQVPQASW